MLRSILDLHVYLPLPSPRELDSGRVFRRTENVGTTEVQRQVRTAEFQAAPAEKATTLKASEVPVVSVTKQGSDRVAAVLGTWTGGHSLSEQKGSSRTTGVVQIIKPASLLGRILDMHKAGVS